MQSCSPACASTSSSQSSYLMLATSIVLLIFDGVAPFAAIFQKHQCTGRCGHCDLTKCWVFMNDLNWEKLWSCWIAFHRTIRHDCPNLIRDSQIFVSFVLCVFQPLDCLKFPWLVYQSLHLTGKIGVSLASPSLSFSPALLESFAYLNSTSGRSALASWVGFVHRLLGGGGKCRLGFFGVLAWCKIERVALSTLAGSKYRMSLSASKRDLSGLSLHWRTALVEVQHGYKDHHRRQIVFPEHPG